MAHTAMFSDVGVRYHTNQDAACIQVARTCLGEAALLAVCDGVGGLAWGELASATVVDGFCRWFRKKLPKELPGLMRGGLADGRGVEAEWRVLLSRLNEVLLSHGQGAGHLLGTCVSAVFVLGGDYVAVQVGDGRVLKLGRGFYEQISEDQTLLAHKLRTRTIASERDAPATDANTILQAVGSQRNLRPVFYHGSVEPDELLVVCCDGIWRKVGNTGIYNMFGRVDFCDEGQLDGVCQELARHALSLGETDNMTVACLSGDLERSRRGDARCDR